MATLKPTRNREAFDLLKAELKADFYKPTIEASVPVKRALYDEMTACCLSESVPGGYLHLPPPEMLDAEFFERLAKVLSRDTLPRIRKLWLLRNWKKRGFKDMYWEACFDALPRNIKQGWTLDAFIKYASDMGLPRRMASGPKPKPAAE